MSLACNRCNVDIWINIHNGMCASCYYELHPDNLKIFAKYCNNCQRTHRKTELCPKERRNCQ